ncbi:ATP-binding protein [Deinococcus alpinitundrae]|uniref:ATP-binding protein n=1 Tax=Deinococcus alpinitundrae TaxID=468913 RepID=UPI00137A1A9C|nr:AAA family ATPase [Deinococcus alpinitundrae]
MIDLNKLPAVDHDSFGDLMLDLGDRQSVMLWGPPGLGKTEVATRFAQDYGYHFFNLVAPMMDATDLLVPRFLPGTNTTVRCPPHELLHHPLAGEAQQPSFVLLDELNAAEVSTIKALFSLINERRLGNVVLPKHSIVVCIGNPPETNSGARPLLAPIMNRLLHVQFRLKNTRSWLGWFTERQERERLEPLIARYIQQSGLNRLVGRPGDDGEISTSPRAWVMLARALSAQSLGWPAALEQAALGDAAGLRQASDTLRTIASGAVSENDAVLLANWWMTQARSIRLEPILRGELTAPFDAADRLTLLTVLSQLRGKLVSELPALETQLNAGSRLLAEQATRVLRETELRAPEALQAFLVGKESEALLPGWFLDDLLQTTASSGN